MGRHCRRVPIDWEHPRKDNGNHQPMFDKSFREAAETWKREYDLWEQGKRLSYTGEERASVEIEEEHKHYEFWEWDGGPPDREYYRPDWPEKSRTHYQMYEDCSEGTPISSVFATPEELARWLTDNNASAFGDMTANYEQWLNTCKKG